MGDRSTLAYKSQFTEGKMLKFWRFVVFLLRSTRINVDACEIQLVDSDGRRIGRHDCRDGGIGQRSLTCKFLIAIRGALQHPVVKFAFASVACIAHAHENSPAPARSRRSEVENMHNIVLTIESTSLLKKLQGLVNAVFLWRVLKPMVAIGDACIANLEAIVQLVPAMLRSHVA